MAFGNYKHEISEINHFHWFTTSNVIIRLYVDNKIMNIHKPRIESADIGGH